MSTAIKATVATGSVAGGALGGAALGGAFSSSEDKSKVTTQKETDKTGSVSSSTPTNTTPSSVSTGSNPKTPIGRPFATDPTWSSLSAENDSSKDPYKGKIGETYGHLLTGTYGLSQKTNEQWWNKKFTEYSQNKDSSTANLSSEFATTNVTSAFVSKNAQTNDPNKALNKVCDSVYQKEINLITPNGNTQDNKFKLKENLWKYCSNLETPPKTIQEEPLDSPKYDTQSFGELKKTELMSVKENINVALWKHKQTEFFALNEVSDPYFKTVHAKKNSTSKDTALRDGCKEAYTKKSGESGTSPTQDAVEMYCSIKEIKTIS